MADNNEFGAILRAERENRKLGLREFAATIHYSPGHVSKVELGHVDPSPEFVKACDLALLPDPPLVERARFTPRQAARFTSARPAQLPDPGAELVGRGAALDTLARQAETAPTSGDGLTIVLHGPPGIGKTALALRWARDHAYRYPDGNLLADLHGYSQEGPRRAGDVIEDWLRAFGVSADRLPESADDRAALLRSVVAGKRLLIVLDNVSAAAQIAPLLPAGSGTAVLVLSRSDLPGSLPEAARVELGGLAPEHALRMLRGIVGAARADAEPAAAADLARDYAPLPLALRLLGEYMAARPDADLTDLAAEAARALPRQQETLREAFAWSYSRLSEPASTLFRMLGLHAGTEFGLAAAAAMLGRAVDETAPLLVELVAARLLQPLPETEARYRFHDLLRGFAADLADATLPEDVRTRTVNRALSFYLHTAAAAAAVLAPAGTRPAVPALPPPAPRVTPQTFAADETDAALAWCDTEADNLLAAAEQAFDLDRYREAWLLPAVASPWLHLREAWRHWMRGAAVGLIAARRAGDRAAEAWCLHSCGRAHQELRRLGHARRSFTAAAAIREEIGDQGGLAWSTLELGAVLLGQGHPAQAREHLERSLQLFDAQRMRGGVAVARIWLGRLHRELGDLAVAAAQMRAARELFVSLEDSAGEALALACLAQVQRAEGDLHGALHRLDRSLQLRTAARDLGGEARVQTFRAQVLGRMGEKRLARRALAQALQLFERLRDPRAADVRAQLAVLDLTGLHTAAASACLPAAC